MARRLPASLTAAALLLVSVAASLAGSSPITVLSSNGLRAVLAAAAPQFEHASGNQLAIQYSVSSELKERIESGEPFDVAIVTPPVIDGLIARGTIAANTRTEVARSGFGIAVRRGARKPDLRTVDAMKTALLSAKSIAFATEGAGGLFFTALVNTLGLSERLSPKFKPTVTGVDVSEAVASGAADLGVQPISEILFVPGVELAGGFPAAVQGYSVMVAGISTASKHGDAAKALIAFLTSSALEPELKRRGMERVPQARSDRHTRAPSARNGPS